MTRKQKRPKPRSRPGPGHSKLLPYADQIKAWRREGDTWNGIALKLKKKGCSTDASALCRFIKRYEAKPYMIGQAPVNSEPVPHPRPAPLPVAGPTSDAYMKALKKSQQQTDNPFDEKHAN